jgi:hypothetical protein
MMILISENDQNRLIIIISYQYRRSKMLKISNLMRNHLSTQISSAFGVVTKDQEHHGK